MRVGFSDLVWEASVGSILLISVLLISLLLLISVLWPNSSRASKLLSVRWPMSLVSRGRRWKDHCYGVLYSDLFFLPFRFLFLHVIVLCSSFHIPKDNFSVDLTFPVTNLLKIWKEEKFCGHTEMLNDSLLF